MAFNKNQKSNSGQALVEVLLAVGIAALVLVALTKMTTLVLKNAQQAKHQALATKHAQEAMEKIRAQRDQLSWSDFKNGCDQTFSALPDPFKAPMASCVEDPAGDKVEVTVTVGWDTHEVELVSFFSQWK